MNTIKPRTEDEMLALIKGRANQDDNIRAVYLNGSRANPNVAKDEYQDYDIVYVVTDTSYFLRDKSWISCFGDIAICQEPDSNDMAWGMNADVSRGYTWLMLFKDGTRIDLHIETIAAMQEGYGGDSLTLPLLDKDGILKTLPPPSEASYYIKKPSKEEFAGCCNEFWWCLNSVAKGIRRGQLPYALRMYNTIVHIELEKMVEWDIASRHGFTVTTGMWGKYFKDYLSSEEYARYMETYPYGNELVRAVFEATSLFSRLARAVANQLEFTYNFDDENGVLAYLQALLY